MRTSIDGLVVIDYDPGQAVIAGASVTIRNVDTKTMWSLYSGLGGNNYAVILKRATLELAGTPRKK